MAPRATRQPAHAPHRRRRRWRLEVVWKAARVATPIVGYEITIRATTETMVSRVVPVGNVTEYLLANPQADDLWIGIRSVAANGGRSLVRSFHDADRLPGVIRLRPLFEAIR
ncbi:MAG: hypothetical protein ACT4O1_17675 [Gemmatimonadota bacterium]